MNPQDQIQEEQIPERPSGIDNDQVTRALTRLSASLTLGEQQIFELAEGSDVSSVAALARIAASRLGYTLSEEEALTLSGDDLVPLYEVASHYPPTAVRPQVITELLERVAHEYRPE